MTSRHTLISKWLPAYALGDLDETRETQVKRHMTQCARCRAGVSRLQGILELANRLSQQQAESSLQIAALRAISQTAERRRGEENTVRLPPTSRTQPLTWGKIVGLSIAALLVVGALVTLQVRLHRPDPPLSQGSAPLPHGDTQYDVAPAPLQTQVQRAVEYFEQDRLAEFTTIFRTGDAQIKLSLIDHLANLEDPRALSLLTDLAALPDLPTEVQQAATRALEATEPLPAGSAEPNRPIVPETGSASLGVDNTLGTRLGLRVVDAETGEVIPGVECRIGQYTEGKTFRETLLTDARGRCVFDHQDRAYRHLNIRLFKPGFALRLLSWKESSLPLHHEVTLEKGVTIGGVVKTEAGEPIAGVRVTVRSSVLDSYTTNINYAHTSEGGPATDEEGRWRHEHFPSDLQQVRILLSHPEYVSVEPSGTNVTLDQLVNEDFSSWMNSGIQVTGSVMNQSGEPIQGASVLSAFSGGRSFRQVEALTDAEGMFTFERWESGQTVLTVKVAGFAQACRQIIIGPESNEVHFVLQAEHTLNVTVVDPNGNPIAGALVEGHYWHNEFRGLLLKTIRIRQETNEQGHALLQTLPPETIGYRISKAGYADLWRYDMTASEGNYQVMLWPQGRVTGLVYDGETGEPIRSYTCKALTQGANFLGGQRGLPLSPPAPPPTVQVDQGRYDLSFTYQTEGTALRVQAPGYLPYKSPTIHNDGTTVVHDVYLRRAESLAVTVYDPNGSAAAKVKIWIVTRRALVRNGRISSSPSQQVIEADDLGQLQLTPPLQAFKLLILSERGFAEVKDSEVMSNPTISLERWGRVEGSVYSGLKPVPNASVSLRPDLDPSRRTREKVSISWRDSATTDPMGHFALDRVRPGPVRMGRRIGSRVSPYPVKMAYVAEVIAGQTVSVRIGGGGRQVTGRFLLPDALDPSVLKHGTFDILPEQTRGESAQVPNVVQLLEDQGLFIDDIKPGRYLLKARFHDPQLYDFLNRSAYPIINLPSPRLILALAYPNH